MTPLIHCHYRPQGWRKQTIFPEGCHSMASTLTLLKSGYYVRVIKLLRALNASFTTLNFCLERRRDLDLASCIEKLFLMSSVVRRAVERWLINWLSWVGIVASWLYCVLSHPSLGQHTHTHTDREREREGR